MRAVLDGELVAFGPDASPDFERMCDRMVHRHSETPLTFVAFATGFELNGPQWQVPEAFEDGQALWEAV